MAPTEPSAPEPDRCTHVAYLVSRFPKLSETFVLYEFLALQSNAGRPLQLTLFALKEEREPVRHRDASKLLPAVVYRSPWHLHTWVQAAVTALSMPMKALRALGSVCWHNLGSPRFLLTSLVAFPSALALAREMKLRNVEHIHAHFANVATTTAYIVHALTGIPFSFTAHGSDLHRDQTMLAEKIAAASRAITVSGYNADMMRRLAQPEMRHKVEVIYCGADVATFAPDSTALNQRLAPRALSRVRIGCVGTLLNVKGQRYLLEALAQLQGARLAATCMLIGDGPERRALEQLALSLGVDVEFAGALSRDQVAARLREFDIVVAPSVPTSDGRKEGIPVALMEAMASGAAVIASDLTGIPELVIHEQTGLLVPPGDPAQLANAIYRLADDAELRARCITGGLARVTAEFDLHTNARKVAQRFSSDPEFSGFRLRDCSSL